MNTTSTDWYHAQPRTLPGGGPWARLGGEHTFRFIVLGDTHATNMPAQLMQHVEEINLLDPDLVMHLGDFVLGGKEKEWELSNAACNKLEVPLVMMPGNHDVTGAERRQDYERRFGSQTYFSFDHKGVHFVVLDSETPDEDWEPQHRIDGEQLQWLEKDLASVENARATFVFLHKPYWFDHGKSPITSEHWMRDTHPILARHGVDAVFAGHVHKFIKTGPIDGVNYYVTFSASGKLLGDNELVGDFHNCLQVTVRGDRWKVAVLNVNAVRPDTIVQIENHKTLSTLSAITIGPPDPDHGPTDLPITINLANPSDQKLMFRAEPLETADGSWTIQPARSEQSLDAGAQGRIELTAALAGGAEPFPLPKIRVSVEGLEPRVVSKNVIVPVTRARRYPCPRVTGSLQLTGRIDDAQWSQAPVTSTFIGPHGNLVPRFATAAQFLYDAERVYLALRCADPNMAGLVVDHHREGDEVYFDDSVEVYFVNDQQQWCQFVFNSEAVTFATGDHENNGNLYSACEAKSHQGLNDWTIEAAIDWRAVGLSPPAAGAALGLQIVRNRAQSPAECTQWSPTFGRNLRPEYFGTLQLQ